MEFSYGPGQFIEGDKKFKGEIILGQYKLYLRDSSGDLAQTYIPLDKIERIRQTRRGVEIYVRLSIYFRYVTLFEGERQHITELIKDLVKKRALKKQFLKNEWIEGPH